ncbi:hypothetical protein [Oceanobacillus massiliensis]|uniref:hypothetical protein n=1 Tax=Oceanobacillus massiliensis TaxID=1465765 RepID=UPI0002899525|nr:hypothetical protein [Oceanobacillus massiliensis]
MGTGAKTLLLRKLTTTFITTTLFSLLFVFYYLNGGFEFEYNIGDQFITWFFVYAMYIGGVILFYGNLVSILIESLQKRWFQQYDWLYILILGLFGLANGVLFQNGTAALYGMYAAIVYGVFDKWLSKRKVKGKGEKPFLIMPMAILLVSWTYLQLTSTPMPPFTKDDAVQFATSGKGSLLADFPKSIGKWESKFEGYHITRETSAKEIGDEVYIVTFTEHWKIGSETGTSTFSYKVERHSVTAISNQGDIQTPYDSMH